MLRWKLLVKKKDSAFVYAIFESLEGWASYSTIDQNVELIEEKEVLEFIASQHGMPISAHDLRMLQLVVSPNFESEVQSVISGLKTKINLVLWK